MTEINFTSTYRIPISQPGVNAAKKAKLKELIVSYPNGLIGNSKVGNARVSVADSEDENFVRKLKTIGYKIFQKFEGENIEKDKLDIYIKEKLDTRNYNQLGKNKKRMTRELKEKHKYENSFNDNVVQNSTNEETPKISQNSAEISKADKLRQSPKYQQYKEEYGEAFAEAVFFGIKK